MPNTLLTGRKADLGHGLTVRRLLPAGSQPRCVGPFVFFDHAGPVTLAPEDIGGSDVRPRPHSGLLRTRQDGPGIFQK